MRDQVIAGYCFLKICGNSLPGLQFGRHLIRVNILGPVLSRCTAESREQRIINSASTQQLTQLLNGLEKLEHLGDLARELSKFTSSITGEEVSDTVVEESHKEVAAEEPKEMIATPKAKKGKKVEIKEVDTEMETPKSAEKPSDEKEVDDKADSKSAAKKRKVRDPNAPKHPLNSYMLFQNKMRPIIKEELTQIIDGNPVSVSNLQLTQELSLRWKSLNEKEKEVRVFDVKPRLMMLTATGN